MNLAFFRLMQIHNRIDDEIVPEQHQRIPDVWRLQKMKRLKLSIKDRLHQLGLGRTPSRA